MGVKRAKTVVVRRAPGNPAQGLISVGGHVLRAALGRGGAKALKLEGDGGTPIGTFPLRQVLYRADRGSRPRTKLPVRAIRASDAWCEDPAHRSYNRLVKASAGTDRLMREDHLYDLVVVLGHNERPRVKGKGSAIFMHLARPGYTPTEGCIALSRPDLALLLRMARPASRIRILP